MYTMLIIILMVSLLIGVALLFTEPFKRLIPAAVDETRGSELSNAILQRPEPPKIKLVLFRVILSLGVILLWPVLLPSVLKSESNNKLLSEKHNDSAKSLRWSSMGGAGEICCKECEYSENIVSFLHWYDSCTSGYQCRSCGCFAEIEHITAETIEGGCDCGGVLSRENALFCPRCKSEEVKYSMKFIT